MLAEEPLKRYGAVEFPGLEPAPTQK